MWEEGGFVLSAEMEEWYPEKEIIRSVKVVLTALTCLVFVYVAISKFTQV